MAKPAAGQIQLHLDRRAAEAFTEGRYFSPTKAARWARPNRPKTAAKLERKLTWYILGAGPGATGSYHSARRGSAADGGLHHYAGQPGQPGPAGGLAKADCTI